MKKNNTTKAKLAFAAICLVAFGCSKSTVENTPEQTEEKFTINNKAMAVIPPSTNRTLVWSDEFSGTKIDTNKWEILNCRRRQDAAGNPHYWASMNAYLNHGGSLVIRTNKLPKGYVIEGKENGVNYRDVIAQGQTAYAGACIRTRPNSNPYAGPIRAGFQAASGYFEIKAKLQTQQGHWGAFWLFTQSVHNVNGNGEDGTEIDVFESPYLNQGPSNKIGKIGPAMHYDGYGSSHQSIEGPLVPNANFPTLNFLDGGWHTFGVEWTPTQYKFYYDGELIWTTNWGGVSKVPQYLKISDEIGTWGGNISLANLPDRMFIDYVRVYDKY